jgi:sigma-B regulation protein RsbU (phosphoserine phosphatase)
VRFRWKLLILLVVIAVLPMAAMRTFGVRVTQRFGEEMTAQTRAELNRQTEERLKLLVDGYAEMLNRSRALISTAMTFQVKEIELALSAETPRTGRYRPDDGPAAALPEPPSRPSLAGDSERPAPAPPAALEVQTPPAAGHREPEAERVLRLFRLSAFYREIAGHLGGQVLWYMAVMEAGPWSTYPAVWKTPADFDPRTQPWYRETVLAPGTTWSRQFTDPLSGEQIIVVSAPFAGPDGKRAGMAAMGLSINRLFENPVLLAHTPADTQCVIGYLDAPTETGGRGIRVLARAERSERARAGWQKPDAVEWLVADDAEAYRQVLADLEREVGGSRRMGYRNCDCLWVYRPIHRDVHLLLVMPSAAIFAPVEAAESRIREQIEDLLRVSRHGIAAILALVVALAFLFARSVTKPLRILAGGARRLSAGDFNTRVDIRSSDEFGEMGRVFNLVGPRLEEHYRIRRALDLAKEVQQSLLPKKAPSVRGLDIAGRSLYSEDTGGDYFDYFALGAPAGRKTAVVVGDVSGHGLSSALLMTSVRALLRFRAFLPGGPAGVVADLNRQLSADNEESGQFVTLFYAEADMGERSLRWVRAGHDPAVFYDPAEDRFDTLEGQGAALGLDARGGFEECVRSLRTGQIVAIGTDGIWEARNAEGRMFGKPAYRALIRANAGRAAHEIIEAVFQGLAEFRRGAGPPEDDITLVVVKITA